MPTPVIVVTDLYQPPEDPGDNFDILLPFGYDRIDLRPLKGNDFVLQPIAAARARHQSEATDRNFSIQ